MENQAKTNLLKELKNVRSVQNENVPKCTIELKQALKGVLKDVEQFQSDLSDSGTCVMGMCLYINVAEPRKRYPSKLIILNQIWQGSTPNEIYFKRVKEYLANEIPELANLVKMDWGVMD